MADSVQQSQAATRRSQLMVSPLLRLALLLGVTLHLVGFLVFRVVSSSLPERAETRPFVEYVSAGSLASDLELEEQVELFDSAPLFIPTRWNASQVVEVGMLDGVRWQFPEFEPDIQLLRDLEPSGLLVANSFEVEKPGDLLMSRFWRFFSGFAETTGLVVELTDESPVAKITLIEDTMADPIFIPADFTYTTATPVSQPVQYFVRIVGSGAALGAPTLGESSGNETFDRAVAAWLKRSTVIGQLPKGYLSIQVFPW